MWVGEHCVAGTVLHIQREGYAEVPGAARPAVVTVIHSAMKSLLVTLMLRVSEQAIGTGQLTFTGQTDETIKTSRPKHLRPL